MMNVREQCTKYLASILPEATLADRRASARLYDSKEGRAYLGNTIEIIAVKSSPSGMESKIEHDSRIATRRDANRIAPRSSSRVAAGGRRDPRGKPPAQEDHESSQVQQDSAFIARRLDTGWSEGGYQ